MKLFFTEKQKNYPELCDLLWISDLAFLVDMLHYLNGLIVDLQGKLKMVPDLVRDLECFHIYFHIKTSGQAPEDVNGSIEWYAILLENVEQS